MEELILTLRGREAEIESLPLNDISDLLENLDALLVSQAASYGAQSDNLHARLTAMRRGSIVLVCELPPAYPQEALRQIQSAITEQAVTLTYKAHKALTSLLRRLRAQNLEAILQIPRSPVITLTPETVVPPLPVVTERATIYGVLTRIGGDDPPRALLRLPDGNNLTVNLTRSNAKGIPMARQLARRLYQMVGLRGEARIRLTDNVIEYMRADEILPYAPEADPDAALAALRNIGKNLPPASQIERFYADIYR